MMGKPARISGIFSRMKSPRPVGFLGLPNQSGSCHAGRSAALFHAAFCAGVSFCQAFAAVVKRLRWLSCGVLAYLLGVL